MATAPPRGLTQPHIERHERRFPDLLQKARMPALGTHMRRHAVIKRARLCCFKTGGGRSADEPVQKHRNL